ncbi:universal stress protein [Lactiplantibacillus paraplantarum]|uniref:universal stress protein n=1 Tax=Lactiplantibacillus paraplantarum TaxID=60520 RepID=UPI0005141BA8|nr:universal stress protein [Lactiplantibacillus paraplantarum]OAX74980.1 universal stress protein UspA [Lactiplantibacillus plantarum]ALO04167.1 universal stress protein UspA [Lactiplantibacillus paraplantarum]KGE74560.1 universal stress protein UspA [Lactiplantibacillus paraplantarum]MCT4457628.1 universal stress protein [Lactiplantibacillus paraplantarum]MCW1910270.1 universal stress protein [Lactiplantibacillus paraplantarum]
MYKRILVPLDGSDNAYYALEHAIALAKVFDSQLFLLNVIDVNRFGVYSPDVFTSAAPDMMSFDQAQSKKLLERAQDQVAAHQLHAETIRQTGVPKVTIAVDVPKAQNIDLIVIGRSGTNAISRLFLGSTTAYVVRNTEANVTVVNMPNDEAEEVEHTGDVSADDSK